MMVSVAITDVYNSAVVTLMIGRFITHEDQKETITGGGSVHAAWIDSHPHTSGCLLFPP